MVFGFENTLSAEDNARILDRVGSAAFKIFYDVGNTTRAGYDVIKEIRCLGRERICQFHLKDEGYLGEGKIDFRKVFEAIDAIGFTGYANFETRSPSKNVEADQARNLAFVRKVIAIGISPTAAAPASSACRRSRYWPPRTTPGTGSRS